MAGLEEKITNSWRCFKAHELNLELNWPQHIWSSIHPSLSIHPSIHPSLSIHPSIHLSIHPSIHPSSTRLSPHTHVCGAGRTSGVTSRGAKPVPPVVKIRFSSFSSHQSIRVSWTRPKERNQQTLTCLLCSSKLDLFIQKYSKII